ncbi:MAG: sugar phosphate nucleotidyltransferase [Gemmatimonadota bacterium]
MEALLLAAGLGTRLGELTRETPKALVTVAGVPMLERVARRLVSAGVDRIVINTHHHADQIVDYARSRGGFGAEVVFSHEVEAPLETGGALKHAADLFRADGPIIVHNVDILTTLPLPAMVAEHERSSALVTLAVMQRDTERYLLFDDQGLLGRVDERKNLDLRSRTAVGKVRALAFAGVHVIRPELLTLLNETGVFSILDPYLRLAGAGERILPFDAGGHEWIDIGKPERLAEANQMMERDLP